MKTSFRYNRDKDIGCLLQKGKSSSNSPKPTKQYEELVLIYGENPSHAEADSLINSYLLEKSVDIDKYIDVYQKDWDAVAETYTKKAEELFGVTLPEDTIAYLTINSRCPYSLEENYFFVTVPTYPYIARKTTMHELWHFYTWYGLGIDQEERLGKQKYNDLKESMTVLLNVEYKNLLGETQDIGYPQHQEIRQKILELWIKDRNIKHLWEYLIAP